MLRGNDLLFSQAFRPSSRRVGRLPRLVNSLASRKPGSPIDTGGGGGVGIQGVQLATAMGLRSIVVDTGDERAQLAKHHGAEVFLDFQKEEDTAGKVVELTEGGAHGVFVTAVQAYPTALGYLGLRAGAKVMWCVLRAVSGRGILTRSSIGLPPAGKFHIDLDPSQLVFRNQSIQGTLVSSAQEIDETLDFAKRGTTWTV